MSEPMAIASYSGEWQAWAFLQASLDPRLVDRTVTSASLGSLVA